MRPSAETTPPPWRVLILMSVLMLLMHVFDGVAITELTRRGAEEANPVTAVVLRLCGTWFIAWKAFVALCLVTILAFGSRWHRILWYVFVGGTVLYLAVTALNAYLLFFVRAPA